MAGPFADGGTGAVVGGQAGLVAAAAAGWPSSAAAGTAAAVRPADAIRVRRVSGRRTRRSGSGVDEVIRVAFPVTIDGAGDVGDGEVEGVAERARLMARRRGERHHSKSIYLRTQVNRLSVRKP